jgi:putative ATPase
MARARSGGRDTSGSDGGFDGQSPSLFEAAARKAPDSQQAQPLPERLRPQSLDDVVGQQHILGAGKPLAEAIEAGRVPSLILWGPPGTGKTTLARLLANSTKARFVPFSAVLGGVADIRRIVAEAKERRSMGGGRTMLFVDEIHRFNKAQQDAFLPHVEDGSLILVGATTENPSFSLNAPLLSRCVVYRLHALSIDDLKTLLWRALGHPQGFSGGVTADESAIHYLAAKSDGDGRRALQALEVAVEQARRRQETRLTRKLVESIGTETTLLYDRAGEEHYNVTSAFIKSMRGSDPDAAVYWMMRMVAAGEDPLFILRRMIIFASEDIGNADPRSLSIAVDADRAFRRLGMPEGLYALAQAATYLASAPKSNAATLAFKSAQQAIDEHGALPVPLKLRNAPTALMKAEGYGEGYRYPHDEEGGVVEGEIYLPEELSGLRFYTPAGRGFERYIAERLRRIRGEGGSEPEGSGEPGP